MNGKLFYVTVRENLEHELPDYYPQITPDYIKIARLFKKNKKYPVLSVDPTTVIGENGESIETSRFLVPTENNNIIWVLAEIFSYAGLTE